MSLTSGLKRFGLALLGSALFSSGCAGSIYPFVGGQYPFEVFVEMHYSPAYRSQEPGGRMANPDGAVPVVGREVRYTALEARALRNPVPRNAANDARSDQLFGTHCAFCHGKTGKGDAPVKVFFESPAYRGKAPVDITAAPIAAQSDGELYLTLQQGKNYDPNSGQNGMPPFGDLIPANDRWLMVNAIRKLQGR